MHDKKTGGTHYKLPGTHFKIPGSKVPDEWEIYSVIDDSLVAIIIHHEFYDLWLGTK